MYGTGLASGYCVVQFSCQEKNCLYHTNCFVKSTASVSSVANCISHCVKTFSTLCVCKFSKHFSNYTLQNCVFQTQISSILEQARTQYLFSYFYFSFAPFAKVLYMFSHKLLSSKSQTKGTVIKQKSHDVTERATALFSNMLSNHRK